MTKLAVQSLAWANELPVITLIASKFVGSSDDETIGRALRRDFALRWPECFAALMRRFDRQGGRPWEKPCRSWRLYRFACCR
jgi:hypothetical protein